MRRRWDALSTGIHYMGGRKLVVNLQTVPVVVPLGLTSSIRQ